VPLPLPLCSHEVDGDTYPFAVVGCLVERLGDRERTSTFTRYYLLNADTGQRYVRLDGCTFEGVGHAHSIAALCKRDSAVLAGREVTTTT
jgi:hypothetical protein